MKRYFLFALLLLTFFFVSAEIVSACTCTPAVGKSDKELVELSKASAKAVFIGRVIKIVNIRDKRGAPTGAYNAVFEISEIWKGTQRKQLRVFNGQCCVCTMSFSKGKEYLVFADGDLTGLSAHTCGRTG